MSLKNHMSKLTDGILDDSKQLPRPAQEKRIQVGMTAPGGLAHFSKDFTDMKVEVDRLKASQGLPATLLIAELHTSPYQTRRLNEEKVAELTANLMANPLSTPITVRRIGKDQYEIVTGHHRVEAFKHLGRKEIPASVIELTDAEAERLVFYDNLLAPLLTDYEKYAGFARLKSTRSISIEQLATEAGVSKALVGIIMSFERLPADVIEIIANNPTCVGANLASKLATIPDTLSSRVLEAVQLIADNRLSQAGAMAWVNQREKPTKPETTTIKYGRFKFADVVTRDNQISIKFADPKDAVEIEQAIVALLKAHATAQKSE